MTLTDFLLARIAEDEVGAREASPSPWSYPGIESVSGGMIYDKTRTIGSVYYEQPDDHDGSIVRHMLAPEADANGAHIARHDPARVLAECEAKRRIVEQASEDHAEGGGITSAEIALQHILCALALPYADHPDYREEWKP